MSTRISRWSHWGSALVLACTWACGGGGASGDESASGSTDEPAAAIRHVVTLDDDVRARVTFTTVPVVRLATDAPIAAMAETGVDEHHYAIVDAPAPGRVVALLAHVGDVVAAGDPLAELASGDVGERRAQVAEAEAHVHTLEARLARRQALTGEQLGTQSDVEDAERELASARAELDRSRAGLTAANARGGSRTSLLVRSPIAGTVLEHHAFPGESAAQDDALFEISDLSQLWLLAHVSEADATHLHEGDVARISFPSGAAAPLELPIALVAPRVDERTLSVEVRMDLPNPGGALRPGMIATVIFTPPSEGATLVVPSGAVQHTAIGWCVFVPQSETEMEVRPIARGRDLGGEVEILSGLSAGDQVVLQGAFVLRALADAGDWGENG
ncbi:MAG: efflux RND transporter periplasmic adaptor subunit [Sandaracinus sp.]